MSNNEHKYIHRDLSWLEFNQRVLEQAKSERTPLLERLKFLSIVSSNLDEFFMVRIAGLQKLIEENLITIDYPSSDIQSDIISKVKHRVSEMVQDQYNCLYNKIIPLLTKNEINILKPSELNQNQKNFINEYFKNNIFPVLTPLAIDPAHPSPFFTNLDLYIISHFRSKKTNAASDPLIGFTQVPDFLPKLVAVPATEEQSTQINYVLIEDIITSNLASLYIGFEIESTYTMRVTRNLDYTLLENEVVDLLKSIQKEMIQREFQEIVRLEISENISDNILNKVKTILDIKDETIIFKIPGTLTIAGFSQIYQLNKKELKENEFNPRIPSVFSSNEDIFSILDKNEIILHHPYDSFYPVIELLNTAASHPDVLAIKQTLYRTSGDSPIINALIEAAQRGKQVTAVIELKARFDEQNNIEWARRLERAGVNVVYGFVGLKTHAKALLIIKSTQNKLSRYVHLSTGNYNSSTAKLYTDIGLMSSDKKLCEDITYLFNMLTGFNIFGGDVADLKKSMLPNFKKIVVAPISLRSSLLKLVEDEIVSHRTHKNGKIILKMNSLTDKELIDALYNASQEGVQIELIIRGICSLRPGVKDLSENIRVRSIVDRFLEHTRVFYFYNNGQEKVYLSSADWMLRNMVRRVECLFPVESIQNKNRIINEILAFQLKDNTNCWQLKSNGKYEKLHSGQTEFRSQNHFIDLARKDGIKSIPYDEAIRYKSSEKKRPVSKRSQRKN